MPKPPDSTTPVESAVCGFARRNVPQRWPFLPRNGKCAKMAELEDAACDGYQPAGTKDACASLGEVAKPEQVPDGQPGRAAYLEKQRAYYDTLSLKSGGDDCLKARRCLLSPYKPKPGQAGCCKGQTGHHLIEAGCFFDKGRGGEGSTPMPGCEDYNTDDAPCVCVEGTDNTTATHGLMHAFQGAAAIRQQDRNGQLTYPQSRQIGLDAMNEMFGESKCDPGCTAAQLDKYHNDAGISDDTKLRASTSGRTSEADRESAERVAAARQDQRQRVDSGADPNA